MGSDDATTLTLSNRIDITTAASVRDEWVAFLDALPAASEQAAIVVDGAGLERIDTAGVQLLGSLWKSLVDRGNQPAWKGSTESLRSAARTIGMESHIGLVA